MNSVSFARRVLAGALLLLSALPLRSQTRRERLHDHVYYLAADSLNGRKAGSPDATKAAEYIIRNYEQAGLRPFFPEGWYDRFSVGAYPNADFKNVVGFFEGTDPALKDEYIVLGAHYDHLGVKNGQVYNGADDNASGSAALIEIARALAGKPLRRSVIIAAFDGEELGLFGSNHLAQRLDTLGNNIKLMMSVDMVGWLKAGKALQLIGVATIKDGKEILRAQAGNLVLDLRNFERSVFTATDTDGFARNGVPTLAVTTGLKSPYHKPEDDAELIDYEGLDKVTGYLSDLTEDVATRERFTGSDRLAPKHRPHSDYGVEVALFAGYTNNQVQFPDAAFDGKIRTGWNAGVEAHVNLRMFGIIAQVLYDRFNAAYPDLYDSYDVAVRLKEDELCVPVSLVFQTPRSMGNNAGAYFGAGPYYARRLSWSTSVNKLYMDASSMVGVEPVLNQWGWNYTAGVQLGNIQIGVLGLSQIGRLFPEGAKIPAARRFSTMLQLKYIF